MSARRGRGRALIQNSIVIRRLRDPASPDYVDSLTVAVTLPAAQRSVIPASKINWPLSTSRREGTKIVRTRWAMVNDRDR